ncbi:g2963 [Coccomyxa viridis]|uniref:G2963 protein n=1 Tax=Coccomyxa viridis TaxID=1274662 RepID=A0ABP1FLN9_9CHLO
MNNNLRTERALLGVFAVSDYIDVGTTEKPCPYLPPGKESRDAFKGKQLIVQTPKPGKLPSTFFEKEHPYIGKDLPYVDRTRFKEEQQNAPPKGFCSSDFMRRGEFTSTIRTEQYRTMLKARQEDRHARRALKRLEPAQPNQGAIESDATAQQPAAEVLLFDLVYDDGSRLDRATASKLPRDTLNRTALTKERRTSHAQTTMQRMHGHPGSVQRAMYGHMPIIETTFYRKSNAFLLA